MAQLWASGLWSPGLWAADLWEGGAPAAVPPPALDGARETRAAGAGLTPRPILEAARDRSPCFTIERHPNLTLLRALSAEERRMVGKCLIANPASILAILSISLTGYDFAAGYGLPAYHRIDTAAAIPTPVDWTPYPLAEVSWANRHDCRPRLAYAVAGGRLYLSGQASDWTDVERVDVSYAPVPTDLTTLDDRLVLPDSAESYLVAFLAQFMGRRDATEIGPAELAGLNAERVQAENDFLSEIQSTYVARVIRARRR